jgi:hypothetical protein
MRKAVPPVNAAYQRNVPDVALVADRVTVPAPQRVPPVGVGATAIGLMVAITGLLGVLSQVPLLKVT